MEAASVKQGLRDGLGRPVEQVVQHFEAGAPVGELVRGLRAMLAAICPDGMHRDAFFLEKGFCLQISQREEQFQGSDGFNKEIYVDHGLAGPDMVEQANFVLIDGERPLSRGARQHEMVDQIPCPTEFEPANMLEACRREEASNWRPGPVGFRNLLN